MTSHTHSSIHAPQDQTSCTWFCTGTVHMRSPCTECIPTLSHPILSWWYVHQESIVWYVMHTKNPVSSPSHTLSAHLQDRDVSIDSTPQHWQTARAQQMVYLLAHLVCEHLVLDQEHECLLLSCMHASCLNSCHVGTQYLVHN